MSFLPLHFSESRHFLLLRCPAEFRRLLAESANENFVKNAECLPRAISLCPTKVPRFFRPINPNRSITSVWFEGHRLPCPFLCSPRIWNRILEILEKGPAFPLRRDLPIAINQGKRIRHSSHPHLMSNISETLVRQRDNKGSERT